jgi:hypothetical protein
MLNAVGDQYSGNGEKCDNVFSPSLEGPVIKRWVHTC